MPNGVQDCSANPADCLKIRCKIPQLRGLAANEAKISFRAFVDERFFSVSYLLYTYIRTYGWYAT